MTASLSVSVGTYSIPVAIEYKSVDVAICVQFFVNTITRHRLAGRNFHEGRTWNFCSLSSLQEYFPFWTQKMIRKRVNQLVSLGILLVGNFNKKKYDRTLWYAFSNEQKFGIPEAQPISPGAPPHLPKRANGNAQKGEPIPSTKHRPKSSSIEEDNDGSSPKKQAAPSMPFSPKRKGSLYKGKAKFTEDQRNTLNWLETLGIDTSHDTLSWWARTYTLTRLQEVHREATRKKRRSIGAYMQKLLKTGVAVVSGRIEVNAEFCQLFKDLNAWHNLEIFQKYAKVNLGSHSEEIPFDMEPESFLRYLAQKYETLGGC